MNWKTLTSICAIGLVVGFGIRAALSPSSPSRTERIAQIFEHVCVAHYQGHDAATLAAKYATPVDVGMGGTIWIDGQSVSFLSLNKHECSIQTTSPHHLSDEQASELATLTELIVKQNFPELIFDPKAVMGSISKGWFLGKRQSPERWGISFFGFPDWDDQSGSFLTFHLPRS